MFRGSSYSMQTDRDVSFSSLMEEKVNIALVGISEVGKSSLLNCIQKQQFSEDISPTNGFQLRFKKIRINHHLLVNLTIWDGSGDRMIQYIQDGRLRSFDGILYVYDLTNPHSAIQLDELYTLIRKLDSNGYVSLVAGNKADLIFTSRNKKYNLEQNQAYYLANKFCERYKIIHQSVSAKLNNCVTDCFVLMIKQILNIKKHIRTSNFYEQEQAPIQDNSKSNCHCECNLI